LVLAIPLVQLDSIIQMSLPFVQQLSCGSVIADILSRIQYIPARERDDVVSVCLDMLRSGNICGKQVPKILAVILGISYKRRSEFLNYFDFFCSRSDDGRDVMEIVECLQSCFLSKKERNITLLLSMTYEADPISWQLRIMEMSLFFDVDSFKQIVEVINTISESPLSSLKRESLIVALARIPKCGKPTFFKMIKQIMGLQLELEKKLILIELMSFFPPSVFDHVVAYIESVDVNEVRVLHIFKILHKLLIAHPDLKVTLHANLIDKLTKITNQRRAYHFAKEIQTSNRYLQLEHAHPLFSICQMIIHLQEANIRDTNPYRIYANHIKNFALPISVGSKQYRYGDLYLSLNFSEIKKHGSQKLRQNDVDVVCKKSVISSSTILELVENMKLRVASLSEYDQMVVFSYINGFHEFDGIERTLRSSFDALCQNIQSEFLLSLIDMEPEDGIVNTISAYFKSIIASIQSKPSTIPRGSPLTQREEALLKASCSIRNCKAGKTESIVDYYNLLPNEFKYTIVNNESDLSKMRMRSFINDVIQKKMLSMFMRDAPFLRELTRSQGPVPQLAHVSIYAKNMLAPHIGMFHEIEFDLHTQVLGGGLLSRTPRSAMEVFFRHFRLDDLISDLQKEFEQKKNGLNLFTAAVDILPRSYPKDKMWKEDKISSYDYILQKEGMLHLLTELGYVDVIGR